MNRSDQSIDEMAEYFRNKGYSTSHVIRHFIRRERERCLQIATLPQMAVKDIVRAIKSGNWITPGNE
jgi:hypothetical protein